ncbi:hypothetical protein D9757_014571 [Collybiopsis confluens]|uniref:Exportin-1 n=1 Tax=Collybiopsis confluens TaxID=2823264 RepID=A0A8H5CDT0_9AGAR|nr:hypothetical protein D9757_014571 [Collybiopsis confluens]
MEFQSLLDFSQELDVGLLDRIVLAFFSGVGPERQAAQTVLTQFQDHPDAWTRVPEILQKSSFPQTKYIALQILEKLVTTRWKSLPDGQRQGVRNFLIQVTIEIASDESVARKEKVYLNKLNLAMVQVLKQEWPHNWPTFISELVDSSKTSLPLCENNMILLRLLSEEIFDFSADQMTQAKAQVLKVQLSNELSLIFQLCLEVLKEVPMARVGLLRATLETLGRFLSWIPLGYVFETELLQLLVDRFLESADYRNLTLKCAAEIASLPRSDVASVPGYDLTLKMFFMSIMTTINKLIPPSTDIASAYRNASDTGQEMVMALAMFLASFFGKHLALLEEEPDHDALLNAHFYLIKISQVDEREVWKICLEYWLILLVGLYEEVVSRLPTSMGTEALAVPDLKLRKDIYAEVLTNLRLIAVGKMVKPEEVQVPLHRCLGTDLTSSYIQVLIVENEEGEVVREHLQETDTIVLYKLMRELMLYLTHLDVIDTERILTEKLERQMNKKDGTSGDEWSWGSLNTLCWAVGSISGAMDEDTEKRFLVLIIRELLSLVEQKRGKDNKAIIASNIMYIVGQYPRFLKAHWRFLKTVVNKLFEFMHEAHEGVQDMACDTYMKITKKCAKQFVVRQSEEKEPFVEEILRNIGRITVDLSPQQVHTFYEATGVAIAEAVSRGQQEKLIAGLMEMPNSAWDALMIQASVNPALLHNPESVKLLSNVLKTNVSACTSIGGEAYTVQVARIFTDMLGLYKASGSLRALKKDILKLMQTYINSVLQIEVVNENFIPPLLDAVLGDYQRQVGGDVGGDANRIALSAASREAEVLNLMSDVVRCLGSYITPQVPPILSAVLEPTLEMITQDLTEYPDHRLYFFRLLRMIILNCFPALLSIPPEGSSCSWTVPYGRSNILRGIWATLDYIPFSTGSPSVAQSFYRQYFLVIVQEIFYVLTDSEHKSGFGLQALVLARMFKIVGDGGVEVGVLEANSTPEEQSLVKDKEHVKEFFNAYCVKLLSGAFSHVHISHIQALVDGMSKNYHDINRFKTGLKDFLVQMKEYSAEVSREFFSLLIECGCGVRFASLLL